MDETCPVCTVPWPVAQRRCSNCGLPSELRAAVSVAGSGAAASGLPVAPAGPGTTAEPSSSADPNGAAVHELLSDLETLRGLNVDTSEAEQALARAARASSYGRFAEASDEIVGASEACGRRLADAVVRRRAELDARRARLSAAGLDLPAPDRSDRRGSVGVPSSDLLRLREEEAAVAEWEDGWTAWRTLEAERRDVLLLAESLGFDPGGGRGKDDAPSPAPRRPEELGERVIEARARRADLGAILGPAAREALDRLLEQPARLGPEFLDPIHVRNVRERIERQLAHDQWLPAFRTLAALDRRRGQAAEREGGTLPPGATAASEPTPRSSVTSAGLLAKTRELHRRVLALPHGSSEARHAAEEIRRATDLLRAGELAAADAVLGELVARFEPPSAPGAR